MNEKSQGTATSRRTERGLIEQARDIADDLEETAVPAARVPPTPETAPEPATPSTAPDVGKTGKP